MSRNHIVVAEAETLIEIALLDPIYLRPKSPASLGWLPKELSTHTTEHRLQHSGRDTPVKITIEFGDVIQ